MRHGNHRHQLGVKKAHRSSMLASLAVALITHGRIKTTLAKAKALRPFIEKIITMSVKARKSEDAAQKLHFRRLAISRIRDKIAIKKLFDECAEEFLNRPGGYARIYKLIARRGDSADMALIEFIDASDEGHTKSRKKKIVSKPKIVQHEKSGVKPDASIEGSNSNC